MIYLSLFFTFFKIGLFGFGGGYGMLSLIQHETVESHHWLSTSEFTDIVAISQMTPGPIGIDSATYCGYTAIHNAGYGHLMAELMPIGPGVICEMATISVNCEEVNQCQCSTVSFCISDSIP